MSCSRIFLEKVLRVVVFILTTFSLSANGQNGSLNEGHWRGLVHYEQENVPFEFLVEYTSEKTVIIIINGEERIQIDNSEIREDSIIIKLQPFDAEIRAKYSKTSMNGEWKKGYRKEGVPFTANYAQQRFSNSNKSSKKIPSKWQLEFSPSSGNSSSAVGLFTTSNGIVQGSILSQTGDYRYFSGVFRNDSLLVSSFDGAHGFLFKASIIKDKLSGVFYFDRDYSEKVSGVANSEASLSNPFQKVQGGQRPYFDILSAGDPSKKVKKEDYFGKILIIQLFGTWCPNSMDQTNFLTNWYSNKPKDVELIGITYEPNFSTAYGNSRISSYESNMGIQYDVFLGGELSKGQAALAFPFIDKINAFPTLMILDKDGFIRYVSNYFNGPATGTYYDEFKLEFNKIIKELQSE